MNRKNKIASAIGAAVMLAGGGTAVALAASSGSPVTAAGCLSGGTIKSVSVTATPACAATATPIQRGATAVLPSTSPSPSPGSSSPSPSPTSPSPSPSSSGTPCVTPQNTSCGAYDVPSEIPFSNGYNTYVSNQNAPSDGSQTVTAYNPGDWNVTATYPAGNGSVEAYPDTQQLIEDSSGNSPALTEFSSFTSDFSETMPDNSGTIAEAAYDIWTNYTADIMVWTDTVGRCNAGSFGSTTLATGVSIGGQIYDVYRYGAAGGEIIFVLEGPGGAGTCAQQSSGTVDVLGVLNWVNTNVTAITNVNQVNFGWELCSTGGTDETFTMNSYDMKVTLRGQRLH